MPVITPRATTKVPAALLLGLATVVSGAAEQQDAPPTVNITHNSQVEGHHPQPKWQLCLVGSTNCLNLGPEARPCLLSVARCQGEAGRIERLALDR